jgi:hypothetical protein
MMQSACPIDGDIAFPSVQTRRALHGASRTDTTELEQAVKDRAVVSNIVLALLLGEIVHIVWCDLVQELDVLVRVELCHFVLGGWLCALRCISYEERAPTKGFGVRRFPSWCKDHSS